MPTGLEKTAMLASLLVRNPAEFWGRLAAMYDRLTDRSGVLPAREDPEPWQAVVEKLNHWRETLGDTERGNLPSPEFEREVFGRVESADTPIDRRHNADPALSRLVYLVTRILKPEVVVESGVGHGVTTAHILKALDENGLGTLHSVDLPPLGFKVDDWIGLAIPETLETRWRLHRGRSVDVLPSLLDEIGPVGLFVHDSLFTTKNTMRELELVHAAQATPFGVVANSVQSSRAFQDWCEKAIPDFVAIAHADLKEELIGVAVCH